MKLTGVGGVLSCAHTTPDGGLHGHSYEVVAWFRHGHDAEALRRHLQVILDGLDHKVLPDPIRWAEELAEAIGTALPGCIAVDVNRPAERLFAKWTNEGAAE
jgi:hypothetical protein